MNINKNRLESLLEGGFKTIDDAYLESVPEDGFTSIKGVCAEIGEAKRLEADKKEDDQ